MVNTNQKISTKTLTTGAILTALVIVLQWIGSSFLTFGGLAISLVLLPIVLGAALCGPFMGLWLGLVFSIIVLSGPDAAWFMSFSIAGTLITVLAKGILCGFIAGLVYRYAQKINRNLAVILAAVICPIVNTGIFVLGCYIFFQGEVLQTVMTVYLLINFVIELCVNLVLSPLLFRLLNYKKKQA